MSDIEQTTKAYKIRGRVQGVGFRWWAQREGLRLGLRGTVRNCGDGTVEIAFAGPRDRVSAMEARLHEGPPAARIDAVTEISPPPALPNGFEIGF